MRTLLALLYSLTAFITQATAKPVETIDIYAYHSSPPFVINQQTQKGANYDLVRALQNTAPEGIQYRYQFLARPALNKRLKENKPTIVLWANPAWFEKGDTVNYLWSHPLYWDKDVVVSRKSSGIEYQHITDLYGLKIGARAGYVYSGVDAAAKENKITRVDGQSDKAIIKQLLDGNVDAIIITKSSLLYYARAMNLYSDIAIIGKAHNNYKRHLLISKHYEHLAGGLNQALSTIAADKNWRFRLSIYGLQDLWLRTEEGG